MANDSTNNMPADHIELLKKQYNDWNSVFGGDYVQEIGNYYKNLNGGKIAARQIQEIQSEYNVAKRNIETQLAQRGLVGSGIDVQAITAMELTRASQIAEARATADDKAYALKTDFLKVGLPMVQSTQQNLTSALNTKYSSDAQVQASSMSAGATVSAAQITSANNLKIAELNAKNNLEINKMNNASSMVNTFLNNQGSLMQTGLNNSAQLTNTGLNNFTQLTGTASTNYQGGLNTAITPAQNSVNQNQEGTSNLLGTVAKSGGNILNGIFS